MGVLGGLLHLADRLVRMFFVPLGEDMDHVIIAWGTGLFLLCLTAAICWGRQAAKKKESCKTLCGYALKATGGAKKLKYSSVAALDFGALTHSVRSQVKTIQYVCDSKEAYSLCVMEAKNGKGAKKLYNALKKYQKANSKSDYLSDYSKTEQKVFKNAIYGKKGTFVWYIAMSPSKAVNKKGQAALKKKL